RVQTREVDAVLAEHAEIVVTRGLRHEHVIDVRHVHRREEPADIDFSSVQAEIGQYFQGFGQWSVVQYCRIGAELHETTTLDPSLAADCATVSSSFILCTPSPNAAQRGRLSASGRPATS